jgi:hypothetical protein
MHVRFRLQHNRLQISLVTASRINGRVRQEHVAALGSVPPDMTVQDRVAFWTQVHPRLARLGNRLGPAGHAKVLGELHARVPMATAAEQDAAAIDGKAARKIGIARHNVEVWAKVRDDSRWMIEQKKALIATLEKQIAEDTALAMEAHRFAKAEQDKVNRLKGGEDVDVGEAIDMRAILKQAGWTAADFRRADRLCQIGEEGRQELKAVMHEARDRVTATIINRIWRRNRNMSQ